MQKSLQVFWAVALTPLLAAASTLPAATVYVVVGADTSSVRRTDGGHVSDRYANEFDMEPMSAGAFTTVMSEAFREAHLDSTGRPIVFTWWILTGGWHHFSTNVDAVAATRVYQDYWSEESERWGDEIALHFHNFLWDGSAWVQAPTFTETLWDFEWSISQLVLDTEVFPVSFRSGWNWMSNPYQQTLERWMPFRLEGGSWMTQDVPYHPSFADYRQPGDMRGWEVRHRYLGNLTQSHIDQIFEWAAAGQDQVTCLWSHQYESGFANTQVDNAHTLLVNAAASHPGVEFRYVTAREGMRIWQQSDDLAPPSLSLQLSDETLTIHSDSDVFQSAQPYVAARLYNDDYVRLDAIAPGNLPPDSARWEIAPLSEEVDLLAVAVCDDMGNTTIRELRDGSRRWSSQTEFSRMTLEHIDTLTSAGLATLAFDSAEAVVEQIEEDDSSGPLTRSYWIGQTFVPSQPGLSRVVFGVEVITAPSGVRVELREVDSTGFPDMGDEGLLASASGSIGVSGDISVDLSFDGFALDGRQYALVFLRESGSFRIRHHQTGVYAGGNLVRAYSLDWIHIPAFDCRFQTFDQDEQPDQGQPDHNAAAFLHETGYFLTQAFTTDADNIGAVEVLATEASNGDFLQLQIRKTLLSGTPDFSPEGLLVMISQGVSGPGVVRFETEWPIPADLQGTPLALMFVSPQGGSNSVHLVTGPGDSLENGALFQSTDTFTQEIGNDLWFRVESLSFSSLGTMTWDFDAEKFAQWTDVRTELQTPPGTGVRARFAFAPSQSGLTSAPWSAWSSGDEIVFSENALGRWVRVQTALETEDGKITPRLESFEVSYEAARPNLAGLLVR